MPNRTQATRRAWLEEVARLGRALHKLGIRGTLEAAVMRLGRLAYTREAHIWYRLDLAVDLQRIPLPTGVELLRAHADDLELLDQLPTIGHRLARRRLSQGAELWIAHELGRALFACWSDRRRTPAAAAPGGWLSLPAGTASLNDVATLPTRRGRAVAPAAWAAVAEALAGDGIDAIVTKLEEVNLPSRRAIERAGFRAIASMELSRIGGRARVALHAHEPSAAGFLAAQLAR
jgi:hypothetical protein